MKLSSKGAFTNNNGQPATKLTASGGGSGPKVLNASKTSGAAPSAKGVGKGGTKGTSGLGNRW